MTHVTGGLELEALAVRLKAAGDEGKGLKRNLYKKMNESVQPLARKVADVEHLKPYLPDRYAAVLAADLGVRISKRFSGNPQIEVRAKARQHRRSCVRRSQPALALIVLGRLPASGHTIGRQYIG